jgi:hypothetical protein
MRARHLSVVIPGILISLFTFLVSLLNQVLIWRCLGFMVLVGGASLFFS